MNFNFHNSNGQDQARIKGFTLLEVLITMAILAMISFGIFQAVTSSFKLREDLNNDAEFYTGIRIAMSIVSQDVTMIYSPVLLLPPKTDPSASQSSQAKPQIDESAIQAATAADLAKETQFWSAASDKSGLRPSRFVGTDKKMSFISASNFRIYKDSPESVFAKITYILATDGSSPVNGFKVPDSDVLTREVSTNAFDMDESRYKTGLHTYAMLHGITKAKFTYYQWKDGKFNELTSWDSDKEELKYLMPDKIQLTLVVQGQGGMTFEGIYTFKPELPTHGLYSTF